VILSALTPVPTQLLRNVVFCRNYGRSCLADGGNLNGLWIGVGGPLENMIHENRSGKAAQLHTVQVIAMVGLKLFVRTCHTFTRQTAFGREVELWTQPTLNSRDPTSLEIFRVRIPLQSEWVCCHLFLHT
jgi:hypothetical protein